MRHLAEIKALLDELEISSADTLEDQDLDFKEWSRRSFPDAIALVVDMAVCMANGGGGTVVFGVNNKAIGRNKAVIGVPMEIDVNRLKKAVYDATDPKLTPVFEELTVPEGTGRLLVMQVFPGLPPYTDTSGAGKIRIGKDCQPLTGTLRRRIMVETGETDYTAEVITGRLDALISPSAMEQLRDAAKQEKAPADLLRLSDSELLGALGVLERGRLNRAGVLLVGTEEALNRHVPGYVWTHLRMRTDTQYTDRMDGRDALPVALARLTDRVMADNPITTVQYGLFHFEFRTYPEIALREALLNALCHADYRLAGPVMVKQFTRRIEISNPGGFIGGITPGNILHHPPAARNPKLVEALTKLRLVNRTNLGVQRMFIAFLSEGRRAPSVIERGESVTVTFLASPMSTSFRAFVVEEGEHGRYLTVDHLLLLHYLLAHAEVTSADAAGLCQRPEPDAREVLSEMERVFEYLDRGGTGRGTYWTLRADLHQRIAAPGHPERDRRIDWESAKTRVLSVLRQRAERGERGLSNAEIRQLTHYDRNQVTRLMGQLRREVLQVASDGYGAGARYYWRAAAE